MQFFRLLIGLLPASRMKCWLLNATGARWDVSKSAHINPCIFWGVRELKIGVGASIGTGNVFRHLHRVSLGKGAQIGQLNWISGVAQWVEHDENALVASLLLADEATITSRHYFDCAGGLSIGRLSSLGGVRSTVLTHGGNIETSRVQSAPVVIGEGCLISACVIITPGTTITNRCVVAAGAVVAKDLLQEGALYAGTPARFIRALPSGEYFVRPAARLTPKAEADARFRRSRRAGR